jgi:hypothetical protein
MAELTGTAEYVDLGDGVRLSAPGVIGAVTIGGSVPPRTQAERDLVAAQHNAGLIEQPAIIISHTTSASADVVVSLPPPAAGTGRVLQLLDESGVVSWHFAAPAPDPVPHGALAAPAAATFTIPSARFGDHPASPLTPAPTDQFAPQALFGGGGLFHKIIKVLEFPLAAAVGLGAAELFARWERKHRAAQVTTFPPTPGSKQGAKLSDANWRTLAEGRALLLVHGIFSSCASGFGGLAQGDFWPTMQARYGGRIFAFDHPTASIDPVANAEKFLAQVPADVHLDLDIVCHSRGGLVSRILAGQYPGVDASRLTVHRIVFAGTPNGGTAITEPTNWDHLFDRFTNLIKFVPPGPWRETLTVTDTVLQLIKYAAESAERVLPGLNCMSPGTNLYAGLDGYAGSVPEYYAIDTDFVPPPVLSHLLDVPADAEDAGDALIDLVFGRQPNDVAVPTIGVGDPGDIGADPPPAHGAPPALAVPGFPVPPERRFHFGPSSVWHCSYFNQSETATAIKNWLTPPA